MITLKGPEGILFLVLVLISLMWSQDITHRLLVPLYFDASVSLGYDSNYLRFSADEMDNADISGWIMEDSHSFDSPVFKPEVRLTYSPVLNARNETFIKVDFSYSDYNQSANKSYSSFRVLFEQHLGSYQWLTVGYSLTPDIFLRFYRDTDFASPDPQMCKFTSETIYASYSFPVHKKTWIRIRPRYNRQYFGPAFTEFDTEVGSVEGRFYTRLIPDLRLSAWLAPGKGDNISFGNGQTSTALDRSYKVLSAGIQTTYSLDGLIDVIGFLFLSEYRKYNSDDPEDHLHKGRYHRDSQSSIWLDREFTRSLSGQFRINYRTRQTESQYDWVRLKKTFDKYEIWLKFTYRFSLDLFY